MRRLGYLALFFISIVTLVQIGRPAVQAADGRPTFGHESRPAPHDAGREEGRRDERRPSDTERRDEKRAQDKDVTHVDDAAKTIDLTKPYNSERLDLDALARKAELHSETIAKVEKTLERISRGEVDPHENDGTIFKNKEKRLPERDAEYYREYVYRPDGKKEPGLERVVVGRDGDVYYTPDHYESFQQVK